MERFIELDAEDKLLEDAVNKAFEMLYTNDKYLLVNDVSERAITHKFGTYLQILLGNKEELCKYDVDCEYNKNIDELKKTPNFQNGTYPDIIIHKRSSNDSNLIIMEFKKKTENNIEKDIQKIKDFIDLAGDYKYKYGFFVKLLDEYPDVKRITR